MRKETVKLLRAVRERAEKISARKQAFLDGDGAPKPNAAFSTEPLKLQRKKKLIPYAGKERGAREDLMGNNGTMPKREAKS